MCNCSMFCQIIAAIIFAFILPFNTIAKEFGAKDDIITTKHCPVNCGCTLEHTKYPTKPTIPGTTKPTTTTTTTESSSIDESQPAYPVSLGLFGGSGNDVIRGIDSFADGSYVVCGTSDSSTGSFAGLTGSEWATPFSFVAKLSKTASLEWLVTFGSSSGSVTLEDIAVLSDGNIVTVGYSKAYEYSTTPDVEEIELTSEGIILTLSPSNGALVSQKSVGGKGTDLFNCVSATSTGFVVGGKTDSDDGDFKGLSGSNAVIMSFDNSGNISWKRYLGGSKGGSVENIDTDADNNIYFTCITTSKDGDFAAFDGLMGGYVDTVVIKYDYSGNYLWDYVIASSGRDQFTAIAADGIGGCIVGGNYENISGGTNDGTLADIHNCGGIDAVVFRISSNGQLMWSKLQSGLDNDFITDVETIDGGFVVSGYTTSANRDFEAIGNLGGYDSFVTFLEKSGTIVNMYSYSGSKDDICAGVCSGSGGEVLTVGRTKSTDEAFEGKNSYSNFTAFTVRYKTALG